MLYDFLVNKYYISISGLFIFILSFYLLGTLKKSNNIKFIYSIFYTIIISFILSFYHYYYADLEYKLTFYNVLKYFNIIPFTLTLTYFIILLTKYSKIMINIIITLFFINYIKASSYIMYYNILYYYDHYYLFLLGIFIPITWEFIKIKFNKKSGNFWSTLEHELTHGLFIVLSGGDIKKLVIVNDKGGYIVSNKSNFLITLSPYFFPTLLSIFFLLALIFNFKSNVLFDTFSGILFSIHILSTIKETKFYQTDLLKYGLKTSIYFILLMNFIIITSTLLIISSGFNKALNFIVSGLII